MADRSVGARHESHESEASQSSLFSCDNREFKHDVYGRRQTAKSTSEFLFSSCNP